MPPDTEILCPDSGQTPALLNSAGLTEASFQLPQKEFKQWEPKSLNPRHREIMRRLLEGASNLEIAQEMSISPQVIVLLRGSKLFCEELAKLEDSADFNVIKRAETLSNEALDVLKVTMRQGRSEALKLRAADSILDRAGYGKIEKRVVGIVDGEAVIKEINRLRRERILGDSINNPESTSRPTYVLAKQENSSRDEAAAD